MDQVFVEGLEFTGRHGVTARERRVGHRCRADVVVWLDTAPAAAQDQVKLTANYARLSEIVFTMATEQSYRLLETLAERVAEAILAEMPVARVEVAIRKLRVPVPGSPESCGVRILRDRQR
ncbi:MAG: dihydroneopterin aldolase [Myxococcota bacterium]